MLDLKKQEKKPIKLWQNNFRVNFELTLDYVVLIIGGIFTYYDL